MDIYRVDGWWTRFNPRELQTNEIVAERSAIATFIGTFPLSPFLVSMPFASSLP
jgi:hypothetical protein